MSDILLYRVGYTTNEETEEVAQFRMEELIQRILDTIKATQVSIFLSCGRADSFRAKLNPDYKAHRKQEKPVHYAFLRQYLIDVWGAVEGIGEEADDLIGIAQNTLTNTTACTIDKDILYGVKGDKFDFVKEKVFHTTEEDARHFFYKQLLMGDRVDNIFGITGVGTAKSDKILDGLWGESHEKYWNKVVDTYRGYLQTEWADQYEEWTDVEEERMIKMITLSGQQLKIRSEIGEIWQPPHGLLGD